jgi:hypothetical protein
MLEDVLAQKKTAILEDWQQRLADTYAADTARFLRDEKDPFANPVGAAIAQAAETVVDQVCGDLDPAEIRPALDKLIRIRAVQDFTPSQAVAPLYLLKVVVREYLEEAMRGVVDADRVIGLTEMEQFALKVDRLALLGFDIYGECRQQLADVRVHEAKKASENLLARLNSARRRRDNEERQNGN